ncbi:MAG: anti-phage deoxyguanosine triphosphatase, partial [Vibrio toranzoniae]
VDESFESVLLSYNAVLEPSMDATLDKLKHFVSEFVIQVPQVQVIEYKGQQIIMDMFEAFSADPERLLPLPIKKQWLLHDDESRQMRVIADYISSMTDDLAQKMHQQLFSAHTEF